MNLYDSSIVIHLVEEHKIGEELEKIISDLSGIGSNVDGRGKKGKKSLWNRLFGWLRKQGAQK